MATAKPTMAFGKKQPVSDQSGLQPLGPSALFLWPLPTPEAQGVEAFPTLAPSRMC